MADTKISALTDGTTAVATDDIPVARSGANRRITPAYIKDYVLALANTWSGAQTFGSTGTNATEITIQAGSDGTANNGALIKFRANSSVMGYVGRTTANGGTFGFLDSSGNPVLGFGGVGAGLAWTSLISIGSLTGSFPALKRSGTTLQIRLADDSAYTHIQGKHQTHDNAVAETPTPTHTVRIWDANGVEYKVPCVAA